MKITTNFQLAEFVHPDIYNAVGSRSLDFLHPSLIPTAQLIRDRFGPVTVNDWAWGGGFKSSGLRVPDGDVGARFSAHRFGTAMDMKFQNVTPVEVMDAILANPHAYPDVTRVENAHKTETWLHVEVGVRRANIITFDP